jgi:hypothetical protein
LEEYILLSQKVSTGTEWDGGGGCGSCGGRVTSQPVFKLSLLIVLLASYLMVYSSGKEERSEVPPEDDV